MNTLRAVAAPPRGHSQDRVLGSPGLTPGDDERLGSEATPHWRRNLAPSVRRITC
jgi:hypothetical protein